jgi:hypothetical protein
MGNMKEQDNKEQKFLQKKKKKKKKKRRRRRRRRRRRSLHIAMASVTVISPASARFAALLAPSAPPPSASLALRPSHASPAAAPFFGKPIKLSLPRQGGILSSSSCLEKCTAQRYVSCSMRRCMHIPNFACMCVRIILCIFCMCMSYGNVCTHFVNPIFRPCHIHCFCQSDCVDAYAILGCFISPCYGMQSSL